MDPTEKGPDRAHNPPNLPPGRPIVSVCGSTTENISLFVDTHAKDLPLFHWLFDFSHHSIEVKF